MTVSIAAGRQVKAAVLAQVSIDDPVGARPRAFCTG